MTAIVPITAANFRLPARQEREDIPHGTTQPPAPVAVEAVAKHPGYTLRTRPDIALVAQLMATRMDLPQTRRLRRTGAVEGASAYQATASGMERAFRPALPSWTV